MNSLNVEQVSPTLNRGGVTRSPLSSGNGNESPTASAKAFADDLRRRATHPLRGSDEYQRIVAECVVAHEARRKPCQDTLSSFEWNPRLVAAIVVVLIVLSMIIWVGCQVASALPSVVSGHTTAISRALSQ
jgi:hypothetical protein